MASPSPSAAAATMVPTTALLSLSPTLAPSIIDDEDQGDLLTGILNMALLAMVVFSCIGLCCSQNRGYLAAEQFANHQLDPASLRRNMAHSKWGVLRLKRGALSKSSFWCCFAKDSVAPAHDTAVVFFFPTRLKCEWKPTLAILQFVLGWVAVITTIVGVIAPSNQANKTLGTAALFLGELILQVWYGYLRYPNLMSCLLRQGGEDDGLFDAMRHILGLAYHNGQSTQFPQWLDGLCFPLMIPFHIGALFGCVASFIFFSVIGNDGRRRSDDDFESNGIISALLGAAFGSVIYPLYFWSAATAGEIVAISLVHHAVQEYFEAKLFNKDAKTFLMALFFKFFTEIIGVDEAIDADADLNQTVVNNYNNNSPKHGDPETKGREKEQPLPHDPEKGNEEGIPCAAESDSSNEAASDANHHDPNSDAPKDDFVSGFGRRDEPKGSEDKSNSG